MKKLVEFKLHNGRIPYFIEERYGNINGPRYIGITRDSDECYVPLAALTELTENEVISKAEAETVHKRANDFEKEPVELTQQEKADLVGVWLSNVTHS